MFSEEHLYAIALREASLIGDINFHKLVNAYGGAKNAWEFAKSDLANSVHGIGRKMISEIGDRQHLRFAEEEIKFCESNSIQIIVRNDQEYPNLLNECVDAPAILYVKGSFPRLDHSLSIVGTRKMTNYGKVFIDDFFSQIQNFKIQTVSGLALGVDTAVHQQSLYYQLPTIAILAHGFQTLYPARNRRLSEDILSNNGALITEFNSSQKPDREHFIQRNRVIAGLSPATLVIETGFGGGSMSTANFANIYNRDVYALPGKITDVNSQGCNQLIFQNKANIISTIKSLILELGISSERAKMEELFPAISSHINLSENQQIVYNEIQKKPYITLDDLSEELNWASHQLLPLILDLELLGKLQAFSGRKFIAL